MRTWRFPDFRPPGDGPWTDEPDKAHWIDPATNFDCLIHRHQRHGNLCGYVGLPTGHPWHGLNFRDIDAIAHDDQLNYAAPCQGGAEDGEHGAAGICHVPLPGRDPHVWWVGFHCAGFRDLAPTFEAQQTPIYPGEPDSFAGLPAELIPVYRTFGYVMGQVEFLAAQAMLAARVHPTS